jgi:hypothetical protein
LPDKIRRLLVSNSLGNLCTNAENCRFSHELNKEIAQLLRVADERAQFLRGKNVWGAQPPRLWFGAPRAEHKCL